MGRRESIEDPLWGQSGVRSVTSNIPASQPAFPILPFPAFQENDSQMSNRVADYPSYQGLFTRDIRSDQVAASKDGVKDSKLERNDRAHECLRPALLVALFFGFFPVHGVLGKDPSKTRFTWFSGRTVHTFVVISVFSITTSLSFIRFLKKGIGIGTAGEKSFLFAIWDIMFFGVNTVAIILFVHLATKWNSFMISWSEVEARTPRNKRRTKLKIAVLTIFITSLTLFEHLAANMNSLNNVLKCSDGALHTIKIYFVTSYRQVFSVIPYNIVVGFIIGATNLIGVVIWNYVDLFIMIVSLCLRDTFYRVTTVFDDIRGKSITEDETRELREAYHRVYMLTKLVDERLSPLVVLSFGSNMYFLCLQLLHSLRPMTSVTQAIYFLTSFSMLFGRVMGVCLSAASIPIVSRNPLTTLFSTPADCYNSEVQRLITQITTDELSITGCKFFNINRNLCLTIVGTMITYEIVLVQFNSLATEVDSQQTGSRQNVCQRFLNMS